MVITFTTDDLRLAVILSVVILEGIIARHMLRIVQRMRMGQRKPDSI